MDVKKEETLILSESAAKKMVELAKADKKEGYGLRFVVFPGGCSGLQYGMDFEESASEKDVVVEQYGIKIFIEKEMLDLVKGSKIDLGEQGFKIENPNSSGCSSCNGSC